MGTVYQTVRLSDNKGSNKGISWFISEFIPLFCIRVGAVFRWVYCLIRTIIVKKRRECIKRARTVVFYVIAECVWQIKEMIVGYYYNKNVWC